MTAKYKGGLARREGAEVELADWVIALMPTGRMREAARMLRRACGDGVVPLTALALGLHEVSVPGWMKAAF